MKGWWRVHAIVSCDECDWQYVDTMRYNEHTHLVGKKAQEHADLTGHVVRGEIGFVKHYKRREK